MSASGQTSTDHLIDETWPPHAWKSTCLQVAWCLQLCHIWACWKKGHRVRHDTIPVFFFFFFLVLGATDNVYFIEMDEILQVFKKTKKQKKNLTPLLVLFSQPAEPQVGVLAKYWISWARRQCDCTSAFRFDGKRNFDGLDLLLCVKSSETQRN